MFLKEISSWQWQCWVTSLLPAWTWSFCFYLGNAEQLLHSGCGLCLCAPAMGCFPQSHTQNHHWNLNIVFLPRTEIKPAPWCLMDTCAAAGRGQGAVTPQSLEPAQWQSWDTPAASTVTALAVRDVTVRKAVKQGRKAISQAISWFPALCIPAHKPLIHFRMQRSWQKGRG